MQWKLCQPTSSCRGTAPFLKIPKRLVKGFIGFVRCWSTCATPFKTKSTAAQPKIKPPPRSPYLNTNRCRDTNPREKSPCGARTGKSWARLSEMNSFPHEVSRLIKMSKVKDATRGTTTPGNDLSEKG